jgi:sodium/bile acid cotransporter 7
LHPELLNKIGIALVFLLNGLGLSMASFRQGILRWQVHALIQISTFVVFPLIGIAVIKLGDGWMPPDLQIGFFDLCALPSTVSSSVARTIPDGLVRVQGLRAQ